MIAVTVTLTDMQVEKLETLAARYLTKPEELVRSAVDDFLQKPHDKFFEVANRVLEKNAELYRRFADDNSK